VSTASQSGTPGLTDPAPLTDRGPRGRAVATLILAALLVLLVVIDRVSLVVAERKLAARVETTQHLSARPHLTIEGFPFLLQALQGRYRHVNITSNAPITRSGVTITQAHVQLNGVRVRTSDVLRGTVRDVPVHSGTGTALITYATLTTLVHRYGGVAGGTVTVTAAGAGEAKLTGPLGLSVDVSATIARGGVRIIPDAAELATLPSFVSTGITHALATPIPLPALPFGVTLTSGNFQPTGLILHATAHNSTFPVR
jgi:hypothetical protein